MFQKQLMMRKVVYSLVPIFLFSVVLYGWRSLTITATTFLFGILAEYIFTKPKGKKISEAVLVTCTLYAMSMPPAVPLWIVAIGIVFGVVFAKNIYGGFGRNIFNPAIAGRLFVYVAFPDGMQRSFLPPWSPGLPWKFGFETVADAGSAATPLMAMKEGAMPDLMSHLLGFRTGSIGESSILLIVLAGLYLVATKTANWKIMMTSFVGFASVVLILWMMNVVPKGGTVPFPLVESLFSGSIMYIIVFMVTDPVTAPKKAGSQWLYGLLIGSITALIRIFSLFPEGVSFGLLIGNMFASLLDDWFPNKKKTSKPSSSRQGNAS